MGNWHPLIDPNASGGEVIQQNTHIIPNIVLSYKYKSSQQAPLYLQQKHD